MAPDITLTFDFDELIIALHGRNASGLMLYGRAELEGDEDGFAVTAIRLDDGTRLKPSGSGALGAPAPFEEELFRRIAAVIENDKTVLGRHAALEWADEVERLQETA
jgi:hypothetical protein